MIADGAEHLRDTPQAHDPTDLLVLLVPSSTQDLVHVLLLDAPTRHVRRSVKPLHDKSVDATELCKTGFCGRKPEAIREARGELLVIDQGRSFDDERLEDVGRGEPV